MYAKAVLLNIKSVTFLPYFSYNFHNKQAMETALQLIHRVHASENIHDTHVIEQSFDNHEEAHWQIEYAQCGDHHERAAFYLMGYVLYMFTYFPHNFLKDITVSYYLDVLVKNTKEQKAIAKKFNAKLVDVMYAEDENTRQFRFKEIKDVINYLKFKHQA